MSNRKAMKEIDSAREDLRDSIKEILRKHKYVNREVVRGSLVITARISNDGITVEVYGG